MSLPGRPKGELRGAQHDGAPLSAGGWRRRLDSLYARVLLVQVVVAVLVALLLAVLTLRQQAQVLAQSTAPLWVAALRDTGAWPAAGTGPSAVTVRSTVTVLPGPPPADATPLLLLPRLRALQQALQAEGLPVQQLQVSGHTGDSVVWLAIAGPDGLRWVGVRSGLEGLDVRLRSGLGLAIGGLVILVSAGWLTRRVVQPLTDLRRALDRFQREGILPAEPGPAQASAPTELQDLARQFSRFAHERQAQEVQRRTLLAAISHDLRSPLARIRMAAELLPDDPQTQQRQATIIRNVQTVDRLLGSFIDLARAEEAALDERVDLQQLVADTLQAIADEGQLPAPPQLSLPDSPLWLAPAQASLLERALRNLVDNARQHGAGPIEVSLQRQGRQAVLAVRDHGAGIPAAERQALSQPFQRGERSRGTPGTGLGLSVAQRTAERHGGRLTLADAAPGLRVSLVLPLA